MLSDVFIRRPILATVCSLVIILAGAMCIPLLPIARYPALAPPSVTVLAFYTGAKAMATKNDCDSVSNGVKHWKVLPGEWVCTSGTVSFDK